MSAAWPEAAPPPPAPPVRVSLRLASPVFVYVFLGLNILTFLGQLAAEALFGADVVLALGAKVNAAIVAGQYWRLVTPIFLHVNLLHLVFNSYALHALGPQVEGPFGHTRFAALYVLSGLSGSLLSFALSPNPSVGASGAIFGLIGALAVYLYRHRQAMAGGRRRLSSILTMAAINLVIGLQPGIDNWAHLGGLIGGAALTALAGPRFSVGLDQATGLLRVVDGVSPARSWLAACLIGAAWVALAGFVVWSGGAR